LKGIGKALNLKKKKQKKTEGEHGRESKSHYPEGKGSTALKAFDKERGGTIGFERPEV